jgi:hypothetical protein
VVKNQNLTSVKKASASSVVKEKYTNRREHREDTELTENNSASSVVKENNRNRREHRKDTELTENNTASSVVKNTLCTLW